jgi:O-antigen/teichoic acid export membrane protein
MERKRKNKNKNEISRRICSFICTSFLLVTCFLFAVIEFAIPFIVFGRCDKYADRTSVHSCFAYVLVSPLFIISVISIISVIVSVFYTLIGLFLHFGVCRSFFFHCCCIGGILSLSLSNNTIP